jgi:hypothetical protein
MRASILALFLLCASVLTVQAQTADVVMGEVAVANRSDATRAAALPQVFAEAIRRLTPETAPQDRVDLAAALEADPLVLQRFEYEQVIRATARGIPSIKLMLRAWFNVPKARSLLVNAGVPVWPGGGVGATLWLVDDSSDQRRLVDGNEPGLLDGLGKALGVQGVRVMPALNDLEDWRMVDALSEDGVAEALPVAALRTGAEPAVLAWLRAADTGLVAQWYVHAAGRDHRFTSEGEDIAGTLAAGAPTLLELFAAALAVRPESVIESSADVDRGAGDYVIWLTGLDRAGSYVQALELLRAQPMVTGVSPEQADGTRVRVRAQVSAPLGQLLALLAADGRLRVLADKPEDADLSLQWQP